MHRRFLIYAAVLGALAVTLGAFGAHGLEKLTADDSILHIFHTGVQYQFYHVFALLAVAILYEKFPGKWLQWSGKAFIWGIILFSGSLYVLTFLSIYGSEAVRYVGPVTPIGGNLFVGGWICLLVAFIKGSES